MLHNLATTRRDYIEYKEGLSGTDDNVNDPFPEALATKAGKKLRNYYAAKYFQ